MVQMRKTNLLLDLYCYFSVSGFYVLLTVILVREWVNDDLDPYIYYTICLLFLYSCTCFEQLCDDEHRVA